jgi:hypothetical protein
MVLSIAEAKTSEELKLLKVMLGVPDDEKKEEE